MKYLKTVIACFSLFYVTGCGGTVDNSDANKALDDSAETMTDEEIEAEQELN